MNSKIILAGGNIVDGTGAPQKTADLIIEGGRIVEILSSGDPTRTEASGTRIDCSGCTIIPGLMDLHVHLMMDGEPDPQAGTASRRAPVEETDGYLFAKMVRNARRTLEAGFTLVREAGSRPFLSVDLRRSVEDGVVSGPRIVAAQPIIMTGGHGHKLGGIEADGEAEVRKAARWAIKSGIDVIKTMATGGVMTHGVEPGSPQLTIEEMKAAFDEAKKAGKRTMTHAQGTTGIRNAVLAGVQCVEHGQFMGEDAELLQQMKESGTAYVATLCNNLCKIKAERMTKESGDPFLIPESAMRKAREVIPPHRETFRRAREVGILLGCGTDAGAPYNFHGENAQELEIMVEYGMTTLEAISTATLRSAQVIGREHEIGSIEIGKSADVVIVEGDLVRDISLLRDMDQIRWVFLNGQPVAGTDFKHAQFPNQQWH
jgi:imidazolonepropionase-like amidohydrolase